MESEKGRKKKRHTERWSERDKKTENRNVQRENSFRIWVDSETGHLFNFLHEKTS